MYRSVWWHDPTEYGAGLNPNKTWPNVMEQYRRPNDQRYYDLPTEEFSDKLYYEHPRLAKPQYRGKFRDHPWTVPSYYPEGIENPPKGFHGQLYRESGQQFKYEGPQRNEHVWLQRPPYLPVFPKPSNSDYTNPYGYGEMTFPKIVTPLPTATPQSRPTSMRKETTHVTTRSFEQTDNKTGVDRLTIFHNRSPTQLPERRITQDGVGFL